jgi:hypothetical protein
MFCWLQTFALRFEFHYTCNEVYDWTEIIHKEAMGWITMHFGFDSQQRQETFLSPWAFRSALKTAQPHIHWVLRLLSLRVKLRLTYHLYLVPRLSIYEVTFWLSEIITWHGVQLSRDNFTFTSLYFILLYTREKIYSKSSQWFTHNAYKTSTHNVMCTENLQNVVNHVFRLWEK